MKVVVLLGPPGVGKGTQAGFLSTRLGIWHVSTGTILRNEIASGSTLGCKVKEIVESGALVNDEVLFSCLQSYLDKGGRTAEILVLDGVPRTLSQVSRLDDSLARLTLKVGAVVALTAPVEALVERFSLRWTCKSCGAVAAFESASLAGGAVCPTCRNVGSFQRREDDTPEAVRKRFGIYNEETSVLLDVYRKRQLLTEVNGLRQAETVYVEVARCVLGL